MFKQLGMFGVLAVCLFAIVIAMVGCGPDEDDPPIDLPPPPPPSVELTPMEKLTGTYSYVEGENVVAEVVLPLIVSGKLHLRPEGNGWLVTYEYEDGDSSGGSGPTWSANATTLTTIDSDGERFVENYTLVGKVLTLSRFPDIDLNADVLEASYIETWRKD